MLQKVEKWKQKMDETFKFVQNGVLLMEEEKK